MESLLKNLTETSKVIDAEVLAKYRQFASVTEARKWVRKELSHLTSTALGPASQVGQNTWFKHLYANLRLLYVIQMGEAALLTQLPSSLYDSQGAEVDILDILTEKTEWDRLCKIGTGTYEMFFHRMRAMAVLGLTLTASPDDYVVKFCTEYTRFNNPRAMMEAQKKWPSFLVSLQTSLKTSPLVEVPIKTIVNTPNQQVVAVPPKTIRRSSLSVGRERVVSFSAVLGLLIVCGVVLWGGPTWKRAEQIKEPSHSMPEASVAVVAPSPVVKATPSRKVEPSPTATASTPERAGFYVIGLASREEASARFEVQKHQQEGLNPRLVYSSNWSGLTPNYYQVVYGIFENRADTTALRKELEKRGIKTYVMHSGQRVRQ